MFTLFQTLQSAALRNLGRRFDRRSRRLAFERFAQLHPRWYAALFDETLLAQPAAAAAVTRRDASALAQAWNAQFGTRVGSKADRLEEVRSVAASYLDLLAAAERELGSARVSLAASPQPTG